MTETSMALEGWNALIIKLLGLA